MLFCRGLRELARPLRVGARLGDQAPRQQLPVLSDLRQSRRGRSSLVEKIDAWPLMRR